MKAKFTLLGVKFLLGVALLNGAFLAASAAEQTPEQLLGDFWQADSQPEQRSSEAALLDSAADIATLYAWLKRGPDFAPDVAVGQQESARIAPDGMRFPYVFLIPDDYDASHSYPLEFMLHGGVSRPEWEPGGGWWRGGFDSLKKPDRIVVVPASWDEAFWWHGNQADNLPAILKTLKQTYNIDDNRVTLTGVSDGGTGAYFFAFKQPTPFAAILPYIGHPGVLRNSRSGGGYKLYFENLQQRPLFIVNGENDRLYPVSSVQPFIDLLADSGVDYIFRPIEDGGHNLNWLPDELPLIEQFKLDNPRDPLPDSINWVADRTDRYNRNLWIRIDELSEGAEQGILEVSRQENTFNVVADDIDAFTLLLNPEEVDFDKSVTIVVNGTERYSELVPQKMETLLEWARKDLDRTMLFTAELNLHF